MTTKEMQEYIRRIVDSEYGLTSFVVLKPENDFLIKKFVLDDKLHAIVSDMIANILKNNFLSETAELDTAENIDDNRRIYYEIQQNNSYRPFGFIDAFESVIDSYSESDIDSIVGFMFRLNVNDTDIWIYQQINYPQLVKKSKNIYAMLSKNGIYTPLNKDILKIERKIDVLILGESIITAKIELMQKVFGFESFIREEAKKTIDFIEGMEIVDDIEKFILLANKTALTNSKKLYKAKNSPVLRMKKDILISKLSSLPRYKGKFEISDGKIQISSQKQATEFFKMLNDSILKSELTDAEYDSTVKVELEPIS